MIMVGVGIINKFFTCNITSGNPVIHQNHGVVKSKNIDANIINNSRCNGIQKSISDTKYKMIRQNDNKIQIVLRK